VSDLNRSPEAPILAIDFDGVIHSYEGGWQNGELYGTLVPGFLEWSIAAAEYFRLVVYSSRSRSAEQRETMKTWMIAQASKHLADCDAESWVGGFEFAAEKPPAFLTIDDRAMQFRGDWSAWWLQPKKLLEFKPWTSGEQPSCEAAEKVSAPLKPTPEMVLVGAKAALDQLCYKINAWNRDEVSERYKLDLLKAVRFAYQAMVKTV